MSETISCENIYFSCDLIEDIAVIHLKERAFEIVTELEPGRLYIETLEAIDQSSEISGMVQINNPSYQDIVIFNKFIEKLKAAPETSERQASLLLSRYNNIISRLIKLYTNFSKPLVAGIHNTVSLEYLGLVMSFDFRVITQSTETAFPNVQSGFPPSGHLVYYLSRFVGLGKTTELLLLENSLSANQLLELGLVTKIVDDDSLVDACIETVKKVAIQPAFAIAATRRLLNSQTEDCERFLECAREIYKPIINIHMKR